MKIMYTVDIRSSAEKVFYWLGDPERAMKWQTGIAKTEIFKQTPNMIGTTFREIVEEDGRSVEMRGEVTDYVQNKLLAMRLEGKYNRVVVEYRLDEIDGRTRLTMRSDIHFKSFLRIVGIFLWPAFRKNLMRQLDGEYARLKELSEQ